MRFFVVFLMCLGLSIVLCSVSPADAGLLRGSCCGNSACSGGNCPAPAIITEGKVGFCPFDKKEPAPKPEPKKETVEITVPVCADVQAATCTPACDSADSKTFRPVRHTLKGVAKGTGKVLKAAGRIATAPVRLLLRR